MVITVIILIALGLASYAAAASYQSVSGLAARYGVPLHQWTPAGLDGGLLGIIIINTALTWAFTPLAPLRLAVRLFSAGTIAANVAAGWPSPVSAGLRVAPSALFVILVEAGQAVLLRRCRDQAETEGIPAARWLLAPWPTFRLWQRMKLWKIPDYGKAVDMELSRLLAIDKLTVHYAGQDWRKAAPRTLVRMLRDGIRMDDALVQVAELVAEPADEVQREPAGSGQGDRREPGQDDGGPGSGRGHRAGSGRRQRRRRGSSGSANEVSNAMEIVTMKAANPDMSNADIGRALGVSGSYVGRILNKPSVPGPDQRAAT